MRVKSEMKRFYMDSYYHSDQQDETNSLNGHRLHYGAFRENRGDNYTSVNVDESGCSNSSSRGDNFGNSTHSNLNRKGDNHASDYNVGSSSHSNLSRRGDNYTSDSTSINSYSGGRGDNYTSVNVGDSTSHLHSGSRGDNSDSHVNTNQGIDYTINSGCRGENSDSHVNVNQGIDYTINPGSRGDNSDSHLIVNQGIDYNINPGSRGDNSDSHVNVNQGIDYNINPGSRGDNSDSHLNLNQGIDYNINPGSRGDNSDSHLNVNQGIDYNINPGSRGDNSDSHVNVNQGIDYNINPGSRGDNSDSHLNLNQGIDYNINPGSRGDNSDSHLNVNQGINYNINPALMESEKHFTKNSPEAKQDVGNSVIENMDLVHNNESSHELRHSIRDITVDLVDDKKLVPPTFSNMTKFQALNLAENDESGVLKYRNVKKGYGPVGEHIGEGLYKATSNSNECGTPATSIADRQYKFEEQVNNEGSNSNQNTDEAKTHHSESKNQMDYSGNEGEITHHVQAIKMEPKDGSDMENDEKVESSSYSDENILSINENEKESPSLPNLKRRMWSPSKKSPKKKKFLEDNYSQSRYNVRSANIANDTYTEVPDEPELPRKRRRKQLHPDKSEVQPSWSETHQPFIEFENSRMFLKFRKNDPLYYSCKECDISFSNEDALMDHMHIHMSGTMETEEQEIIKGDNLKKADLLKTLIAQGGNFPKKSAPRRGKSDNSILKSKLVVVPEPKISVDDLLRPYREADDKMVKCEYCHVTLPSRKGLQRHISFKHKDKLDSMDEQGDFICVLCGKVLKSKYTLKKHWQVHSESRDFKCKICGKGFSYRRSLEMHRKGHDFKKDYDVQGHEGQNDNMNKKLEDGEIDVNEGIEVSENSEVIESASEVYFTKISEDGKTLFHCATCQKEFGNKSDMIYHVGTGCTDKRNKPQKCPVCEKVLKTSVADHIRIHTGERPYECLVCNKMFKRGYHLQIHQQTAHSNEKPWVCEEPGCGKSFKRKDKLQCHKRTHSSEKPYLCIECGNSYKQSHHLNRHKKKSHGHPGSAPCNRRKSENKESSEVTDKASDDLNLSGIDLLIEEACTAVDNNHQNEPPEDHHRDSNDSWDMSKQITETINRLKDC